MIFSLSNSKRISSNIDRSFFPHRSLRLKIISPPWTNHFDQRQILHRSDWSDPSWRWEAISFSKIKRRGSSLRLYHQDDHQLSQRPSDQSNSPPIHFTILFCHWLIGISWWSVVQHASLIGNIDQFSPYFRQDHHRSIMKNAVVNIREEDQILPSDLWWSIDNNRFRRMCFERDSSHLTPQIGFNHHHPFEWKRRWFESSLSGQKSSRPGAMIIWEGKRSRKMFSSLSLRTIPTKTLHLRLWVKTPDEYLRHEFVFCSGMDSGGEEDLTIITELDDW